MPDTAQNVIDRSRGALLAGVNEQLNVLQSGYTAGSGTLTFLHPIMGIGPNAKLSIGQNTFHVLDSNPVAKTATVLAGQDGSTDVNLLAGAVARVNPRFTDFALFTALNQDLVDLAGRGLFQMKMHEFTWTSTFNAYDLPISLNEPYAVRYETPDTHKDWPYLRKSYWRVERHANTTDFPSGQALHLFEPLHNGYKAQLLYKSAFTMLATTATLVSTSGLPDSAVDLLELGIQVRMLSTREAKRNFTEAQTEPRRQSEVQPGGMVRATNWLVRQREERIATEIARLRKQYPDRRL